MGRSSGGTGDSLETALPDLDWRSRCDRFTSVVVILETNLFRRAWSVVLAVLLVYTGTVFPFWLCFMEFKIPEPVKASEAWIMVEWIVDILFWVDLVVNFFFTFRDSGNNEVTSLRRVIWNYLTGFFLLNLIACLPADGVTLIVNLFTGDAGEDGTPGINQATRMARLQRISRLTRLGRLTRLAKMAHFISSSPVMRWLRGLRGMRITNFIVGLLWVVHLIACGWYLCASLHSDPEETWVARRAVDTAGTISLLEKGSVEQWCHAVYFVLTVFTTVGFGDMSATTTGEIVYVCFTMILGAVINSIIVSEVINIVTSVDREQVYRTKQKELISAFSMHTELDLDTRIELEKWIDTQSIYMDYDEEGVKRLLTSGALPRNLMSTLPGKLFAGNLMRNNFVRICKQQVRQLPPRFPVLMALKVYQRQFNAHEYVYHYSDQPYHVFLVMRGCFSHVALPGPDGGVNEVNDDRSSCEDGGPSYFNFNTWGTNFGAKVAAKVGLSSGRHLDKASRSSGAKDDSHADGGMFLRHPSLQPQPFDTPAPSPKGSPNGHHVCPYMLHSVGSFFGDVELMENKPRRSSLRCERVDSALLVLHKQDLATLIDEFPHFGRAWKASARRHERRQMEALEACREQDHWRSYRELAATQISRTYRLWKMQGGISLCARRTMQLSESDWRSEASDDTGDRVHAERSLKKATPLSGFVGSVALKACAQSAAPAGVNSNGEVFAAFFEADSGRRGSAGNAPEPPPVSADSKSLDLAQIHKSIGVMGTQLREEMHSSIAELKNSVDELRRWIAPASLYGPPRSSSVYSGSRPRSSANNRNHSSQRRRHSIPSTMNTPSSSLQLLAATDNVAPSGSTRDMTITSLFPQAERAAGVERSALSTKSSARSIRL